MYLDDMKQGDRRSLRVLTRCYEDVTSAIRIQDAKIKTLENGWQIIANVPAGDIFPQDKSMWEQGGLASADGSNIDSTTRIRSCFVPIKAGQKYKCTADSSHQILTRHYTTNKTYRSTTTSFTNADFEFTTDATDKYVRFVIRNTDDSDITADELDNVCWSCEPVIELAEETADTTEPIVDIQPLAIKAIAYTQGINGGKGEWDGTLEFKDEFKNISLSDISVVAFKDNVATSTLIPKKSSFNEIFRPINIFGQINLYSDAYSWYRLKNEFSWSDTNKKTWKILKEGE